MIWKIRSIQTRNQRQAEPKYLNAEVQQRNKKDGYGKELTASRKATSSCMAEELHGENSRNPFKKKVAHISHKS